MPSAALDAWRSSRDRWLRIRGINPDFSREQCWRTNLQALSVRDIKYFHAAFTGRWHDELDAGHGACLLRCPVFSKIVADSLMHFDGDRYAMEDFVVMPNHVHLLAAFLSEDAMLQQCESWKHFTSTQINRLTGAKGRFWQKDSFDHLVRSEAQFERLKRYFAANPRKARLKHGEYRLKHSPK